MMPIIRYAGRLAFEAFYRRRYLGAEIPEVGPVILVANHPNGLVDPLALMISTSRPLRFLAKAPLFKTPVLGGLMRGMGALPVYRKSDGANTSDNQKTFSAVYDSLDVGELVCLFPEGISHSEPGLQTLKTGAARMALGAEARAAAKSAPPLGVRVVPIGLIYGKKDRFRSRMAIWVGEPIELEDLLELQKSDEREAARELTSRIDDGLRKVTIQLETWQDLPLIELAQRLVPDSAPHNTDLQSKYAAGLRRLRIADPDAAENLQRKVTEFRDRLECLQLAPEDLDLNYTTGGVVRFIVRTGAQLLVTLPPAALGAASWWLPYRSTGWISNCHRVDSDVVATQKILIGSFLFPVWWIGISLAVGFQSTWQFGVVTAIAMPLVGSLALRWGDRFRAARRDVASFFRFNAADGLKAKLRQRREELLRSIEDHAAGLSE